METVEYLRKAEKILTAVENGPLGQRLTVNCQIQLADAWINLAHAAHVLTMRRGI